MQISRYSSQAQLPLLYASVRPVAFHRARLQRRMPARNSARLMQRRIYEKSLAKALQARVHPTFLAQASLVLAVVAF